MRLQPIQATALKARTRKEIFADGVSSGAADQYFRIGPTGGQPGEAERSLPLSPGFRLLSHLCCEWKYRSPPDDEFACRSLSAASWARRHGRRAARVQGAQRPCIRIADPQGDIVGDPPATGHSRVRFNADLLQKKINFGYKKSVDNFICAS